jgi:hypothetical protein
VKDLLSRMPEQRQTLLFSATLPASLAEFAKAGLAQPQLVRLDAESRLSPELALQFFTARCAPLRAGRFGRCVLPRGRRAARGGAPPMRLAPCFGGTLPERA